MFYAPFRELHEYYKIIFERQKATEEENKKRKQEELDNENKERAKKGLPPLTMDDIKDDESGMSSIPSPIADELQDELEDLAEGGAI